MKKWCGLTLLIFFFKRNSYGGVPMEPVTNFDVNRYFGKWYEVARLPASFERNLTNVTATYSLKENGKVKVQNEGTDSKSLKRKTAVGKAKIAKSKDIGYLKVSFFGPFYADYIVLELDKEYQYAMVASSMNYLWILSRKPELEKEIMDKLIAKAKGLGFQTEKLYFTPQRIIDGTSRIFSLDLRFPTRYSFMFKTHQSLTSLWRRKENQPYTYWCLSQT